MNSTSVQMVKLAFELGYRVNSKGEVVSRFGRVRRLQLKSNASHGQYLTFTVKVPETQTRYPVRVHKLAAYQKFGEAALVDGVVTRHKDGNSLNNKSGNILLGTQADNAMDRAPFDRKLHAAGANQQYTEEFIVQLRAENAAGASYKKLHKKYKVPMATLSYYLSKAAKRSSFNFPTSRYPSPDP